MGYKNIVDIEIYDTKVDTWAQGKYLYHGLNDVYWCETISELLLSIESDLKSLGKS